MLKLTNKEQEQIDAAVMRRLIAHLDGHKEVQNIDLMILADFCRNCLGKWYKQAADERGVEVTDDQARQRIYGMPYAEWKEKYQSPATPEQLAAINDRGKDRGDKDT